ncbi:glycosyltransferase [Salinimicrobium sp. HB62]|uniref:glycosyltransferase n=1 Tax=Salinimicrobium sp. HB62 TaxID=3077781 RepID=UPI002D7710AA|nr:glycosyltransferase [Salinimicrobium sp. HB62]
MELSFSFIIPVYNRPAEIRELLETMLHLTYDKAFEVVIVEDGSTISSEEVVKDFEGRLKICYFKKPNSGPGDSRNFGMRKASGNYFLILDSDVLLPPQYLAEVEEELNKAYVHCFGGPDAAHEDFSDLQKAINYAMTSFLTTGGIRGGKKRLGKFQPRSFNMGLSKKAFEVSGGFGRIHPGEDPDLALRLQKMQFTTRLFPEAFVFHKRRIDWRKFYQQVRKFGLVRPILNKWHPYSAKITYWFPTLFSIGLILAVVFAIFGGYWLLWLYGAYFFILFLHSLYLHKNFKIAVLSIGAALIQFLGYGFGFCKSTCYLRLLNKDPEERFPKLFFKHA